MKIEGNKQTPEARRFSTAKPEAPKAGGKSFGALLKKAAAADAPAVPTAPAAAPAPEAAAAAAKAPEAPVQAEAQAPTKAAEAEFADHMETVRFRLKTGYYTSKAIDDALTEKLTGYFDELA